MAYNGSEETTPVKIANERESTEDPQIHLSANDGKMVSDATQIVFHKNEDGTLFIELFTKEEAQKYLSYYIFTLDDDARAKLREFLNCPVTY